jgi:hypothetical protein
MKQTAEEFFALPTAKRRLTLLSLCTRSLAVWESHFSPNASPSYQDSVTGSLQEVNVGLPREALQAVQSNSEGASILEKYIEPIVALQDQNLELPEAAEFAYYAIYNAFLRYVAGVDIEEKLILNQALSALPEEEMHSAFREALADAG